jgi:hypothetical protein
MHQARMAERQTQTALVAGHILAPPQEETGRQMRITVISDFYV